MKSYHTGRGVLHVQAQQQHAEDAYRTIIPVSEQGIDFVSIIRHTGMETLKLLKQ